MGQLTADGCVSQQLCTLFCVHKCMERLFHTFVCNVNKYCRFLVNPWTPIWISAYSALGLWWMSSVYNQSLNLWNIFVKTVFVLLIPFVCLTGWVKKPVFPANNPKALFFQAEPPKVTLQNVSFDIFLWFSFCILTPCSIWERQTGKCIRFGLWQDRNSVAGCSEHLTGHKNSVEKGVLILYSCFHFRFVLFKMRISIWMRRKFPSSPRDWKSFIRDLS